MTLKFEIDKFIQWADKQENKSVEWECLYPHWQSIYDEVNKCIKKNKLSDAEIDLILYALARDNESEIVKDSLIEYPHTGLSIAKNGWNYGDKDARWQIASLLGKIKSSESIDLLKKLVEDNDEYVRRRALLSLSLVDKGFAEKFAIKWIKSDFEYSRLVALDVLYDLESDYFDSAIAILKND